MRTTIQISETLRKHLKIIASYRDISYEEALDDMVTIFNSTIPFTSEEEFAEWFEQNLAKFGFKKIIKKRLNSSPDYQLEGEDGKIKEVELELVGVDFKRHKHDPEKTDLIVCVYSNEEKIDGVPVLPIVNVPKDQKEIIKRITTSKYSIISIPIPLAEKIKQSIKGTGFGSVSDYVTYLLRQIEADRDKGQKEPFTKKDEEKVKDRLRKLGYL